MNDADAQPYLALARAAEKRRPLDIDQAIKFAIRVANEDVHAIPDAAQILAMFGRLDIVFAMLNRYFLDRGSFGQPAPITRYTRRFTDFLFSLQMVSVRADPRYLDLTRLIGLDDYWRQARMRRPDGRA